MEQTVDLQIDGTKENIQEVMDFINVDKTQRSDNQNNLFDCWESPSHENSICTGYTDTLEFDSSLSKYYADQTKWNHICFKSYRKNLFRFANWLSSKYPQCRFTISWTQKLQGVERMYVVCIEKNCVIYYQSAQAWMIANSYDKFIKENHLEEFVEFHTREEQEKIE